MAAQQKSDNRPGLYYDESVSAWVYRASFVGRSLRCLAAARQGYDQLPPPDYLVAAAAEGNKYEIVVKAHMRSEGYRISGEQGTAEIEVKPGVLIRGHLDARHCVAPNQREVRPLEVKSMSQRVFDTWLAWGFEKYPEYAAQITTYMHAVGAQECVYAVVNRGWEGEGLQMDIRILKAPPLDIQTIIQKVALAEHFATTSELPVCNSASQYVCPYDYLCDRHEVIFEELEDGSEKMLNHLGNQYQEIKKVEDDLKERKKEIRNEIQLALGSRNKLMIPGYSFSMSTRTSKTLNAAALRQHMGDEIEQFYEETESAPFLTVRPRKGKGKN